jgi:hypothetical protein
MKQIQSKYWKPKLIQKNDRTSLNSDRFGLNPK